MIDKIDLDLMDDVLGAVSGTQRWNHIQENDPLIQESYEKVMDQLRWIEHHVSKKYTDDLYDMIASLVNNTADAAMLYGLHVADVIRTVSAAPLELSQYILDRMAGKEEAE